MPTTIHTASLHIGPMYKCQIQRGGSVIVWIKVSFLSLNFGLELWFYLWLELELVPGFKLCISNDLNDISNGIWRLSSA